MSDSPTVGRIVHYWPAAQDSRHDHKGPLAAIVVEVVGNAIALQTFNHYGPGGFYVRGVAEGTEPGCWSWPTKV